MIKKKRNGLLFLCSFLVCGLMAPVYGAGDSAGAERSAADYFTETELEEDGNESSFRRTEDVNRGPGITAAVSVADESQGETGPKIHDITLGEKYHEEFGLYEQSLNNQYFLYSNVGNGGITDQPVYVDIPADLIFTMEKDGTPIPYASKQRVGEKGTYVLRITAVYDKSVPLSEQEEYRTVFRFRIDNKAPAATAEAAGGSGTGLFGEAGVAGQPGTSEAAGTESGGIPDGSGEGAGTAGEEVIVGPNGETADSAKENETSGGEQDAGTPAGETEPGNAGETADSDEAADETGAGSKNIRIQTYDKEKNAYRVVFSNGFTFLSKVPENMITSSAVQLILEEDSDCKLYLGEEEIPWETDIKLTEFGQYRLVSGDEEFGFEITNTYVNRDEFSAPVGTKITGAEFQNEKVSLTNGRSFAMKEDGKYTFSLTGEGGERYSVVLNRDTAAPEFTVTVERQQAVITYLANDMAEITLQKKGEEPKAFSSTMVTAPGNYTLTVTDRAGNATSQEFTLKYHLNTYAVTAIVMILAGIIGGVVFLTRKKRNLGVR